MFGQMIVIDELGPGETMSLDGLKVINYPLNSSYLIAERVTGGYQYEKPDIEDENYMLALSRATILGFYLDTYASVYSPEARIVAFSREQSDSKFLAKGDFDTYGMTMFTSQHEEERLYLPFGSDEGASRRERPVLRGQQLRLRYGPDGFRVLPGE